MTFKLHRITDPSQLELSKNYNLTETEKNQKIETLTKSLNEKQKEAVISVNGPLLIVAGAGSGKTGVLTHRIAYKILQGIKPWSILALTFTNKAAKELVNRISKLVDEDKSHKIWAGTFHSIFAKILRIEAENIGFTSNFSIYDTDDSLSAIKSVMGNFGIAQQSHNPQSVRSQISSAKNKLISPDEFTNSAFNGDQRQVGFIYNEYNKYLQKSNAMDFDDILINFIKLLSNKEILRKYQEKFKYILVDEYQDTNKAQYMAISMLANAHQNICVVGDDSQSIYGWRGADIQNILNFQKDYPYCKTVRLEQNYRSTQIILDAADSIIKYNPKRIDKKLWTNNNTGAKINIVNADDEKDEAIKIVNIISQYVKNGAKLGDIAILYRTNAQSLFIENALRKANFNYVVFGGVSFFKRKEIKDLIAYLRLLVNPNDNESLLRVVNEPPRGIGKTSIDHIIDYSISKDISLYQAFLESQFNGKLQSRAVVATQNFTKLVENYKHEEVFNNYQLISEYIENTGLIEMYNEIDTDDSNDRLNNIEQFISDIQIFLSENEDLTLNDYLQQISLVTDMDEKDINNDFINVMTLHSSKGLEFPYVIITGMEQGLFPSQRKDEDKDNVEEERRLFYVGLTRAMYALNLTYSKKRLRFGDYQYNAPSQFLKEIDNTLVIWPDFKNLSQPRTTFGNQFGNQFGGNKSPFSNYNQTNKSYNYSQVRDNDDNYSQVVADVPDFKNGQRVKHNSFGNGTITGFIGVGEQKKVYVRFDDFGKKTLMLKFAKLAKI